MSDFFIIQLNKTGQYMGAANTLVRNPDEAINFHNADLTSPEFRQEITEFTNQHGSVRRVVTDC